MPLLFGYQMGPVYTPQPPSCQMAVFGRGDGEKRVCKGFIPATAACTIISIGCNNEWSYEESAAQQSKCDIHTFDCTGSFTVPTALRSRVTLHKKCVGTVSDGKMIITYPEMV